MVGVVPTDAVCGLTATLMGCGMNIEPPQPSVKTATQSTHKNTRKSLRRYDTPNFWLIRELPMFENLTSLITTNYINTLLRGWAAPTTSFQGLLYLASKQTNYPHFAPSPSVPPLHFHR